MSISVSGALVRNSLALAAEFAAVLLVRGDRPHWLPVMLVLFAFVSGVPNGTDAGFVQRTALAIGAVLIVVCGVRAWDEVLWEALTGLLVLVQTIALTRVSRR
ncbi:hypothetical protein J7E97_13040 [Streptomyces sp. ISL-66]|uniref:hypothetical protein n=1 Tax=Streptomyces sp. ISL-66 TaxID=2819186 RepID=UPI001BE89282|nr:hypothetical protein [Streptomyces sp. ISL-66]MBT2468774.1 hypothetical protein [Streptomyces sp. ISL-66]